MNNFHQAISADGITLVDFYATWCGPCKLMHPILEQLKADLADEITILKIDIDKNPELANKYNVRSVPTLLLFRSGHPVWRQSGTIPLPALRQLINQYM